jgi:hypothetical protein
MAQEEQREMKKMSTQDISGTTPDLGEKGQKINMRRGLVECLV